jgi:hypothetical protein
MGKKIQNVKINDMNVIIKLQNLKPDDLKYLQKPNLDVTKPKLLRWYSNVTHAHESKCTI